MNIFGPQKPFDSSHTWRTLAAIVTVAIGAGVILVWEKLPRPSELAEFSVVFENLPALSAAWGQTGGDVVVAPPTMAVAPPLLPELAGEMLSGETFSAPSIIVKDDTTGAVLYRKAEYEPRPIASLTKLMSALVILEKAPRWASSTQVVGDDIIDMHIYAGDTYTLDQLWHAALIGSSNKAIYTLADAVGWPRVAFVERLNQKARELGMANTIFVDSTGLDAGNVSTASDVAILMQEAMRHERIRRALLTKEYNLYSRERGKPHHLWNTNWLLLDWIPHQFADLRGGKTGYIPESGYNFVLQAADEAGHALAVVILGAATHEARFTEARDLAEWVWENYRWPADEESK